MSRACAASRFIPPICIAASARCTPPVCSSPNSTESARRFRAEGDPSGRFDPPFSTVHVGVIDGGTARNIVARDCVFQWEFRGLPGVASSAARDRLEVFHASAAGARLHGFSGDGRRDRHRDRCSGPRAAAGLGGGAAGATAGQGQSHHRRALRLRGRSFPASRASRPCSAARAASTRRTSRTNLSKSPSSPPASTSCAAWRGSYPRKAAPLLCQHTHTPKPAPAASRSPIAIASNRRAVP